jgi:hypothetical protein
MNLPQFLEGRASELLSVEMDGADRRRQWAVVLGLKPFLDGDQYCVLWGNNIQDGVAGFGKTPVEAMAAFEKAMYEKREQNASVVRNQNATKHVAIIVSGGVVSEVKTNVEDLKVDVIDVDVLKTTGGRRA